MLCVFTFEIETHCIVALKLLCQSMGTPNISSETQNIPLNILACNFESPTFSQNISSDETLQIPLIFQTIDTRKLTLLKEHQDGKTSICYDCFFILDSQETLFSYFSIVDTAIVFIISYEYIIVKQVLSYCVQLH